MIKISRIDPSKKKYCYEYPALRSSELWVNPCRSQISIKPRINSWLVQIKRATLLMIQRKHFFPRSLNKGILQSLQRQSFVKKSQSNQEKKRKSLSPMENRIRDKSKLVYQQNTCVQRVRKPLVKQSYVKKQAEKRFGLPLKLKFHKAVQTKPEVRALAAVVMTQDFQLLLNHNINQSLQVASLTKIMTLYTFLQLANQHLIDFADQSVSIHKFKIQGTSASLKHGQTYSVRDLLFGLMLPSGNDAAIVLAIWISDKCNPGLINGRKKKKKNLLAWFVCQMNKIAYDLKLQRTHYTNVHGMSDRNNKSCALDTAILCSYAMKNQMFAKVVSCKTHSCCCSSREGLKEVVWRNSNRLLQVELFQGIKTGTTQSAGACLASVYKGVKKIFVVVLNCESNDSRFSESKRLAEWASLCLTNDFNK